MSSVSLIHNTLASTHLIPATRVSISPYLPELQYPWSPGLTRTQPIEPHQVSVSFIPTLLRLRDKNRTLYYHPQAPNIYHTRNAVSCPTHSPLYDPSSNFIRDPRRNRSKSALAQRLEDITYSTFFPTKPDSPCPLPYPLFPYFPNQVVLHGPLLRCS